MLQKKCEFAIYLNCPHFAMALMTQTKTILGISLAALFAVFMIAPAFAVGHLTITEAEVDDDEVEIEVAADIPTDGSGGAFGYGVIGSTGILVAATHGGVGPDHPDQEDQSDPVMHTHEITLGPNLGCPDNLAIASIINPSFDIEVDDNELEIEDISTSAAGTLTGPFASFNLSVLGPANNPTAVCVNDLQIFAGEIEAEDDEDDEDD